MSIPASVSASVSVSVSVSVHAARATALVCVAPSLGAFVVTGSDRQSWLNGLVTCDLTKASPGTALYGLVVSLKGRIVSDVVLVVGDEDIKVIAPVAQLDELRAMFDKYLIMEDAEMGDMPRPFVAMVHGPLAAAVGEDARRAGAAVASLDLTGLGGAIVVAGESSARAVDDALGASAQRHGAIRGGNAEWNVLRVERAIPEFGVDFGPTTYPQEAGLEKTAVSFSKGCYLGQEVVCMLEMRGHVNRKLELLRMQGDAIPARGTAVETADGSSVGEVTSAVFSPTAGAILALAMIKRSALASGAPLRVGGQDAAVTTAV